LSADAIDQAKTFILDTIGVGIAGSSAAGADELSQACAGWGGGADSTVWGRRKRVPAPTAAFLNGFQAHCQVWLWFGSPHVGLAARMMRTSEPPHWFA
jgi:2-methylcitrate dehydratase PrpD